MTHRSSARDAATPAWPGCTRPESLDGVADARAGPPARSSRGARAGSPARASHGARPERPRRADATVRVDEVDQAVAPSGPVRAGTRPRWTRSMASASPPPRLRRIAAIKSSLYHHSSSIPPGHGGRSAQSVSRGAAAAQSASRMTGGMAAAAVVDSLVDVPRLPAPGETLLRGGQSGKESRATAPRRSLRGSSVSVPRCASQI